MGPSLRSPTARSTARGSWCEGDEDELGAFAEDGEGAMPSFETKRFDVRAGGSGDAQTVEREETDEGVVATTGEAGGDEHGADLVAVEAGGVRFVVESRSAYVHG